MKIWSYGDSHAAGHELGTSYSDDCAESWLNSLGFYRTETTTARNVARRQLGIPRYQQEIRSRWYREHGSKCTPELSFAGQLADLMGAELVSRAEPGSSNSLNMLKMYEDCDKYQADDLVLFCVVTPLRFIPAGDITRTNHQVHWLEPDIAGVLWEHGPHDVCFRLQTHGYVELARSLHANTRIFKSVTDDMSVGGREIDTDCTGFYQYLEQQNVDYESLRYPGGHVHESCHQKYAEYLYQEIVE